MSLNNGETRTRNNIVSKDLTLYQKNQLGTGNKFSKTVMTTREVGSIKETTTGEDNSPD